MNYFDDGIDRTRYYTVTYACGNQSSLSNDQDPPVECPECGETLVDAERDRA